eukprot:GHVP01051339.1.p1 GENE.GHVP01051339.1~~GHVP01051339.1.p1  ORF type:complete len:637 (+),score=141.08 GHVP01051339.1:3419-5329(+)
MFGGSDGEDVNLQGSELILNIEVHFLCQESDKIHLSDEFLKEIKARTSDHLWMFENPTFKSADLINTDYGFCFKKSSDMGGHSEDSWFIFDVLLELSKTFSMMFFQITDSDGQFLLIESAPYLPKWICPENAANRVWISDGEILLIPQAVKSSVSNRKLSSKMEEELAFFFTKQKPRDDMLSNEDAIKFLVYSKNDFSSLAAKSTLQRSIINRSSRARKSSKTQSMHFASFVLPEKLALLFLNNHHMVSLVLGLFFRNLDENFETRLKKNFKGNYELVSSLLTPKSQESTRMYLIPLRMTRVQTARLNWQKIGPHAEICAKKFNLVLEESGLTDLIAKLRTADKRNQISRTAAVDRGVKLTRAMNTILLDKALMRNLEAEVGCLKAALESLPSGADAVEAVLEKAASANNGEDGLRGEGSVDNDDWMMMDYKAMDEELNKMAAEENLVDSIKKQMKNDGDIKIEKDSKMQSDEDSLTKQLRDWSVKESSFEGVEGKQSSSVLHQSLDELINDLKKFNKDITLSDFDKDELGSSDSEVSQSDDEDSDDEPVDQETMNQMQSYFREMDQQLAEMSIANANPNHRSTEPPIQISQNQDVEGFKILREAAKLEAGIGPATTLLKSAGAKVKFPISKNPTN